MTKKMSRLLDNRPGLRLNTQYVANYLYTLRPQVKHLALFENILLLCNREETPVSFGSPEKYSNSALCIWSCSTDIHTKSKNIPKPKIPSDLQIESRTGKTTLQKESQTHPTLLGLVQRHLPQFIYNTT